MIVSIIPEEWEHGHSVSWGSLFLSDMAGAVISSGPGDCGTAVETANWNSVSHLMLEPPGGGFTRCLEDTLGTGSAERRTQETRRLHVTTDTPSVTLRIPDETGRAPPWEGKWYIPTLPLWFLGVWAASEPSVSTWRSSGLVARESWSNKKCRHAAEQTWSHLLLMDETIRAGDGSFLSDWCGDFKAEIGYWPVNGSVKNLPLIVK